MLEAIKRNKKQEDLTMSYFNENGLWNDDATCPDCGGELTTSWDGCLWCETCQISFSVDSNDGSLFVELYDEDEYM